MTFRASWMLGAVLVPAIAVAVLLAPIPAPVLPSLDTSFETGLEGWEPHVLGVSWGNCTGSGEGNCTSGGSIERTRDAAHEGTVSVRMTLDGGWVWIERVVDLGPGRPVNATLEFAFATERNVTFEHWDLLAFALPRHPTSGADFPTCKGGGILDAGTQGDILWHEMSLTFTLDPDASGHVWVVLGFSASAAGPRTYYLDAVRVSFQRA